MPRDFGVCPATIHLLRPTAFSKSAKHFAKKCQKIDPGAYFPRQNVAPCGFNKMFLSEINFICMNFIRLQGLAAETVSGRNNGLPCCYVEFPIRAKTGFSFANWYNKLLIQNCLIIKQFVYFAHILAHFLQFSQMI